MRGKKAKELRKLAGMIAKGQRKPDLLYARQKIKKQYSVATATGPKIVVMPFEQISLGDCRRKLYQVMKKFYKQGISFYD